MNADEQNPLTEAARAMGRIGGRKRNPHKGFGSGDNAVQAAKARWENQMNDDADIILSDGPICESSHTGEEPKTEKHVDNPFAEELGNRLKDLRGEHKKTRREVANDLKVAIPTLMNWEKGGSEPSASNITKLCEYYKVSADYLLLRTTDRHGVADSILASQQEQTETPAEPEQPTQPEQTVQPSEPTNTSPVEQAVQPSEPEPPTQPEQAVQPATPLCKDCPLVATVQSLSTAIALSLSRR